MRSFYIFSPIVRFTYLGGGVQNAGAVGMVEGSI